MHPFTTLPGGIIMQWGQSGTFDTGPVSIGLATTFPHACFTGTVTDFYQSASRTASVVNCSQNQITVRNNGFGAVTYTVIGW